MRIALYGGSFDPPHVAHQMACLYMLETQDIEEIWMIPCFQHPFDKRSAPYHHRMEMCRLLAAPLAPRVRVSPIEQELGGPSYTLVTVKALIARHPEHRFSLMIGADLVKERERWHGYPELRQLIPFLIVGRAGSLGVDDVQIELPAISSTAVRGLLAKGEAPVGLVPRAVLAYVRQHRLYVSGEVPA
jgi:nicotinate-nucleotide adenylyltransferase